MRLLTCVGATRVVPIVEVQQLCAVLPSRIFVLDSGCLANSPVLPVQVLGFVVDLAVFLAIDALSSPSPPLTSSRWPCRGRASSLSPLNLRSGRWVCSGRASCLARILLKDPAGSTRAGVPFFTMKRPMKTKGFSTNN